MPAPIATSTVVAQTFLYLELQAISSFDDASPQAADAAAQYPVALDRCLEVCDWSFASRLAELPQKTPGAGVVTDPDMPYLFELPGDLIMLRDVGDLRTRWRRDLDGIRADDPGPLRLRYTARVTNEAALPALFRDAVALALAVQMGPRWLSTANKQAELEARADKVLKQAMRADGRSASITRYDGRDMEGDWATEALR